MEKLNAYLPTKKPKDDTHIAVIALVFVTVAFYAII